MRELLLAVGGSFLAGFLVELIKEQGHKLAPWLLRSFGRLAREDFRAHYIEPWVADLSQITGGSSQVFVALRMILSGIGMLLRRWWDDNARKITEFLEGRVFAPRDMYEVLDMERRNLQADLDHAHQGYQAFFYEKLSDTSGDSVIAVDLQNRIEEESRKIREINLELEGVKEKMQRMHILIN